METHPIPRSKRLKILAQQSILDNFAPFPNSKSTKRALSVLNGKKSPKMLTALNSSKLGKPKISLDPRNNRTPEALNSITNFLSESKTQEIRLMKAEIIYLKNALASVVKESAELKQVYTSTLEHANKEKDNYRDEYFNIVQRCLSSNEIDLKFKMELKKDLESLESSKKFSDFDSKQLLQEFVEFNTKNNLFEITTQTNSSITTAKFCSLNEDQMKAHLKIINEAIVIEDFSSTEEGFLSLKTGQRVQVLGQVDESLWIVIFQNKLGKIPAKFLLQD